MCAPQKKVAATHRQHNIVIGRRTAEQVKIECGSAISELENPPDRFGFLIKQ